jgi:transcriptional regulator with XRE-family HTH domain
MSDSTDITFGHRLRVTRLALGISEQGAAEAFGLSLATYRKYELLGIPKRASTSKLLKFARKYDLSLDWLLDGDTSGVRRHLTNNPACQRAGLSRANEGVPRRLVQSRAVAAHDHAPGMACPSRQRVTLTSGRASRAILSW